FLASASSFAALLFASLTAAALLAASSFAFFAAAWSFVTSCLAASASERRCSAAPFDSAAAASCLAAKSAAFVAAASSAGMLTATFRPLGGAARLPFLDFLIFNLAFDFAFDFAFFGMAGHVQSGLSISVQRHAWPGRARPNEDRYQLRAASASQPKTLKTYACARDCTPRRRARRC